MEYLLSLINTYAADLMFVIPVVSLVIGVYLLWLKRNDYKKLATEFILTGIYTAFVVLFSIVIYRLYGAAAVPTTVVAMYVFYAIVFVQGIRLVLQYKSIRNKLNSPN